MNTSVSSLGDRGRKSWPCFRRLAGKPCSISDAGLVIKLLCSRAGARVVGVDTNHELLAVARSRGIPNAEFRIADLRTLHDVGAFDGIWCSSVDASAMALDPTLTCWKQHLNSQGWVALTEIDDLFGHEPIESRTSSLLAAYAQDALAANRYDFHMGRKLRSHLEQAGFTVGDSRILVDEELSFDGPAAPEVLDAWNSRLNRMKILNDFCGAAFERVRDDFLAALSHPDHHSLAKVYGCIGTL